MDEKTKIYVEAKQSKTACKKQLTKMYSEESLEKNKAEKTQHRLMKKCVQKRNDEIIHRMGMDFLAT